MQGAGVWCIHQSLFAFVSKRREAADPFLTSASMVMSRGRYEAWAYPTALANQPARRGGDGGEMLKEKSDNVDPPPQHEPHGHGRRGQGGKATDWRRHERGGHRERRSGGTERAADHGHPTPVGVAETTERSTGAGEGEVKTR